jgi:hypothetical protein
LDLTGVARELSLHEQGSEVPKGIFHRDFRNQDIGSPEDRRSGISRMKTLKQI